MKLVLRVPSYSYTRLINIYFTQSFIQTRPEKESTLYISAHVRDFKTWHKKNWTILSSLLKTTNLEAGCLIHLKMSGQTDLVLINNITPCQIWCKCFGFRDLSQIYILPLCSIFSYGGHFGYISFKHFTPMMIVAKFG